MPEPVFFLLFLFVIPIFLFVPFQETYIEIKDKNLELDENGCVYRSERMSDICELGYVTKTKNVNIWENIAMELNLP